MEVVEEAVVVLVPGILTGSPVLIVIGAIFLTLAKPTKEMLTEAAAVGFYDSELWQRKYARRQILTIEDLLKHGGVKAPTNVRDGIATRKLQASTFCGHQ
jgi:hypothetical protein